MNYIYILWRLQWKRYLRSRIRIFSSLAQPLMYMCVLGFGIEPLFQKATQESYIQFLCPGVVATALVSTSVVSGLGLIWDRQFGFLKQTFVAPAPRNLIMFGRTLGGATISVSEALMVMLICIVVGFRPSGIQTLPMALVFMLLIALMFNALATAIASALNDPQAFPLITNFLFAPIAFLSGAYYPTTNVPVLLRWFAQLNPLSYGVDGLRGVLIGTYRFSLLTDLAVLCIVTIVLLLLGSYLFSKIEA
jgi:ABC-2 type transport system permease protein